jgi:ribosomal protein S15P/S13E
MAKQKTNSSKMGRNKDFCAAYKLLNKRLKNKIRKLTRHINRLPGDKQAKKALTRLQS